MPISNIILDINNSSIAVIIAIFLLFSSFIYGTLKILEKFIKVKFRGDLIYILISLFIALIILWIHYLYTGKGILE